MEDEIKKLREEIEDLKSQHIDLLFEMNYNKEKELLAFIQDLYVSLDTVNDYLTKEEIIFNLKEYIENFAKDNNLQL